MLDPKRIIDEINDDFRVGSVCPGLSLSFRVMNDDYSGASYMSFNSENSEELATSMFDMSLSKKIYDFRQTRKMSEIGYNGFDDGIVGYQVCICGLKRNETTSNITPELIEIFQEVLNPTKLMEFGWNSDEALKGE